MSHTYANPTWVEDNPGDIRLLQEYLNEGSACRFQITQAGRLSMGIERLAEARFDAVLLDLSLPDPGAGHTGSIA